MTTRPISEFAWVRHLGRHLWLVASLGAIACNNSSSAPAPAGSKVAAEPVTRAAGAPGTANTPGTANAPSPPIPPAPTKAPTPGTLDVSAGSAVKPVIHGEKWQNGDEEGGRNFAAFKETWIYVDGVPRGALVFAELPVGLPVAWKDDVEGLDFH